MKHLSIKFRLSLAFYLFLFLVIFLGAISLAAFANFSGVTDQIRDRWLPNTRYLGDLNNYTSDFRAAEGTLLLASNPSDITASEREMDELSRNIADAQSGYQQVYHDDKETSLYRRFSEDWGQYREIVNQVLSLMHANNKEASIILYKTKSRTAYGAVSDTLELLTDLNVANDQEASTRAAATYLQVRLLILFAILSGIMLVVFGVLYIRRSISAPMLDLAGSMNLLANCHVHNIKVDISATHRHDEVGEMARALVVFRNNVVELAESRQGLMRQASMLEEKLQHERNLMAMQGNFISMASHEFRTPLAIIDGHAQRLTKIKTPLQVEEIAERVGKMRGAVRQMTALIDNLINSARLFEGKPELYFHPTEIDLSVILRGIYLEYEEFSSTAQIVSTIDAQPLMLFGDSNLLQQMFGNILSNAIKYSPAGGLIEVNATSNSREIIVTVEDHGIGVPAKDIDGLFERYFRGSNVSNVSGTGIGLYLAKMIAELHGGRIIVKSIEGEGAVFTVHLPASTILQP